MLRKILLAFGLLLIASPALAQNTTCSDRPSTDSSNACANTRFVQQHVVLPGGTNGQIQYNNNGAFGGFTANGDVTINTSTGATVANNIRGVPVITTGSAVNDILAYNGTSYIHTALASLVNTMCSLSPTTCTSLFGYGYVVWWGAVCNGSTDDTAAINNAIAAIPAGSTLVFPSTVCLVSSLTGTGNPKSITITNPIHISFPNGGGIHQTAVGALFNIQSSFVTIEGNGAVLLGPSTSTVYQAYSTAITMNDFFSDTTTRQNIVIRGLIVTQFGSTGIQPAYCYYCIIDSNIVTEARRAGIQCITCIDSVITNNIVNNIWSSTGENIPPDPVNRSDHYGISVSHNYVQASENVVVSNNVVRNVPAWECYDTHSGRNITFVNNIGSDCMIGISAGTNTGLITLGITIANNNITCIALNSPVYSGQSPGTSLGAPAIRVLGLVDLLAAQVIIKGNNISGCGSSDNTLIGDLGAIEVGYISGLSVEGNEIYLSRHAVMSVVSPVFGSILNNNVDLISAGPIGGTPIILDIMTAGNQLNIGGLTVNGSTYDGYNIVPQGSGFQVGISRTNQLQGVSSLYVGSSVSNRVDLGATPP